MVNINKDDLEKALSKGLKTEDDASASTEQPQIDMPKEEEIGFHKGSLNTLVAERNELIKMVANVEAIMQAHIKRLQELGVKIDTQENKQ